MRKYECGRTRDIAPEHKKRDPFCVFYREADGTPVIVETFFYEGAAVSYAAWKNKS